MAEMPVCTGRNYRNRFASKFSDPGFRCTYQKILRCSLGAPSNLALAAPLTPSNPALLPLGSLAWSPSPAHVKRRKIKKMNLNINDQ